MYIETLLVDEELADQVWEAWDVGVIDDQIAWLGWWLCSHLGKLSTTIYTYPAM